METDGELKCYEVGYLLTPALTEEAATAAAATILGLIEKGGGVLIAQDIPRMRTLAYPVGRVVEHKRTEHGSGYFGWIKFEAEPSTMAAINHDLSKDQNIIRFAIIITTKTAPVPFIPRRRPAPRREPGGRGAEVKGEKAPISEEQIDKEIEQMLAGAQV